MRLILTILFLISVAYGQTNYYVANTGSDSNDGLTTATAWQTLSKVNSSTFNAGDSILLKRGDSWNERLNIASSGSAGSPIVVGAYGIGAKPLITGFQTQLGFTNVTGNIWRAVASTAVDSLKDVLINGVQSYKARNTTGYSTYTYTGTNNSIQTSLPDSPSYVGGECVARTANWIIDVVPISSQSSGLLTFSKNLTYTPSSSLGGNGYFLQNDSSFVNAANEYSFNYSTKALVVYSVGTPIVKVSTIDTLIYLNHKSYIVFDNLSVEGANKAAFQFDSVNNITVQNSSINHSGTIALSAKKSAYLSAINDSIQNSLSGAIYWRRVNPYTPTQDTCNNSTITGCYIKNTGMLMGMGLNDNETYFAIEVVGEKSVTTYNTIDSTGANPMVFRGDSSIFKYNFISNFGFTKCDIGGVGTGIGAYLPLGYSNDSKIISNIIINGFNATPGTTGQSGAGGIYIDDYTTHVTLDSNFIYNVGGLGNIVLHRVDSITVMNNIVYASTGDGLYIASDNTYSGNILIKHNQIYSNGSSYIVARRSGTSLGNIDSNYYSRPSNEYNSLYLNNNSYNITDWQAATGKDLHSKITPPSISKGVAPLIVYNPTLSDSTVYFSGYKRSLDGADYSGSITIKPFSGAILFEYIPPYKSNAYKHFK